MSRERLQELITESGLAIDKIVSRYYAEYGEDISRGSIPQYLNGKKVDGGRVRIAMSSDTRDNLIKMLEGMV